MLARAPLEAGGMASAKGQHMCNASALDLLGGVNTPHSVVERVVHSLALFAGRISPCIDGPLGPLACFVYKVQMSMQQPLHILALLTLSKRLNTAQPHFFLQNNRCPQDLETNIL